MAVDYSLTLADNARLFAMLYVALGDAAIASVESKYYYGFWRPITAVRQADTDGNPDTVADASWTPLSPSPNFPDYVSTHSATWGAFSEILRQFFGTKGVNFTLTSVVTGTTRPFTNTDDINKGMIDARVYVDFYFEWLMSMEFSWGERSEDMSRRFTSVLCWRCVMDDEHVSGTCLPHDWHLPVFVGTVDEFDGSFQKRHGRCATLPSSPPGSGRSLQEA